MIGGASGTKDPYAAADPAFTIRHSRETVPKPVRHMLQRVHVTL
jgi:hypothetical protein